MLITSAKRFVERQSMDLAGMLSLSVLLTFVLDIYGLGNYSLWR